MIWIFQILNNRTDITTEVEEPSLWDSNKIEVKREPKWHGVFFESQGDDFEFDGNGEKLLREEYDAYGIEADMTLIISYNCNGTVTEFYRGRFDFGAYSHYCDDGRCFVKCPVESLDDVMTFKNRRAQKADLAAVKSFDGVTDLVPYDKLNFPMALPSKGIFIEDHFVQENDFETPVQGVPENNNPGTDPTSANSEMGQIEIGFDQNKTSEIGNASSLSQSLYSCVQTYAGYLGCNGPDRFAIPGSPIEIAPLNASSWVNYSDGSTNFGDIDNPCNLELVVNGSFNDIDCLFDAVFVLMILPKDKVGTLASDYIFHSIIPLPGGIPGQADTPFSIGIFDPNFTLNKGDRIYALIGMYHYRVNSSITSGVPAFSMAFDEGNYFKLNNLSHTPATISKVNAIMETISRVTEVITDDKMRAYSEYFGRTDSQPYDVAADGCGSLAVVTDGLRIRRQETKTPGETTPFALSVDDLFNGLCPIHNIGIGIEPDPERDGSNRVRWEPWFEFYKPDVLISCVDIAKITRTVNERDFYSSFKFGYAKWEAEEYNGLDEFLTKRTYRTTLSQVNNEMVQASTMIASGYALEITRRKGDNNSKDWRYDKETFYIEATRTRKFHVFFYAATNNMVFSYEGDGSEFIGATTITISGSASNNGTRNIFVLGILSVPGQATVIEIGFSGGTTVDEESFNVTFDIVSPAGLFVELGNIDSPANIIDPDTIYNFRRSPLRNALRWLSKILMSYRLYTNDSKIIFTDGDGNIFAEGKILTGGCILENDVIKENMMLNKEILDDPDFGQPFMRPERVSFDYDMSLTQFNAIKANPLGLIYFENDCDSGYGWIDTVTYKPDAGTASFKLIPKIT